MYIKNILINFRYKFPKSFRNITFDSFRIINYLCYFILLPLILFLKLRIRYFLKKYKSINKLIIRNDKMGDSALTLPFIYGTFSEKNNYLYYFSPYLEKITNEIELENIWELSTSIKKKKNLLIANLANSNIETFKDTIIKKQKNIIFTYFGTSLFSNKGLPIIFSKNYLINKSQTYFIDNCFKLLDIKSDPIFGIKRINKYFENKKNLGNKKILTLIIGIGIDKGRKLNQRNIKDIVNIARNIGLETVILEEPSFENQSRKIALDNNIKIKSCIDFMELFSFLKSSKYVIGYDCGPTHIASILTNTIILFSHTPSDHWGKHIWHKLISKKVLKNRNQKLTIFNQLNRGNSNYNWIICCDEKGCNLHKRFCKSNDCSQLDDNLIKKAIQNILNNKPI